MPKVKLTDRFVKKLSKEKNSARVNYFDTETTGLLLEVRKNNAMTYYYRYTYEYKTHTKKIGTPLNLTVDEARRIVLKLKKAKSSGELEGIFTPKAHSITLKDYYYKHYKPYIEQHLKRPKDYDQYFRCHILIASKILYIY